MTDSLSALFTKGLESLENEVKSYANEEAMWQCPEGISNSGGNLAMHICGNLQHFIGAVLGKSGYERQRDMEFTSRMSREELVQEIENTRMVVTGTLTVMAKEDLQRTYPIEVFGHAMTTEFFMIHLVGHLNYHLGQINYHRRLLA